MMGPIVLFSIMSGFLGFVAFLMFHGRRMDELVKFFSVSAVVGGLVATFWAFYVGLELKGLEGPGWVIFLLIAWELWRLPASVSRKRAARRRLGWKAVGVVLLMVMGFLGAFAYSVLRVLHPLWWAAILYVILVFVGVVWLVRK
jgi:cation transport ATPase